MKEGRRGGGEPVEAVQIPAVAWDGVARVFDAQVALDARGDGVAHEAHDGHTKASQGGLPRLERRQEAQPHRNQAHGQHPAHEAFPRFVGADLGKHGAPAQGFAPGELQHVVDPDQENEVQEQALLGPAVNPGMSGN